MLNLPAAKGRAFSSAGTPSRAIQPPERRRRAGAWPAPGTQSWRPRCPPSPVGSDRAAGWLRPAPGAQLHFGAGWDIPPEQWEGGCEPEGGGTRLTGSDLPRKKALLSCFFSELRIKHLPRPEGNSEFWVFSSFSRHPPTAHKQGSPFCNPLVRLKHVRVGLHPHGHPRPIIL